MVIPGQRELYKAITALLVEEKVLIQKGISYLHKVLPSVVKSMDSCDRD